MAISLSRCASLRNAASHLHLHVFAPDHLLDRRMVVADAPRCVEVDNMDPFSAGFGEARGHVSGIVRVDSWT